ncbi:hypothetical protein [Microcystis aeruginosa]|uniref:hypothetical protein n=1 Tax=Microcystis aeruginosa TaxID=1126 RepID=UPI001EE08B6F|nr:hypothetical protein [Microcystis aeruginosa]
MQEFYSSHTPHPTPHTPHPTPHTPHPTPYTPLKKLRRSIARIDGRGFGLGLTTETKNLPKAF